MADITEHESKEEGEGHNIKGGGVDLLVGRNSVGHNYFMEWEHKLIYFKMCGRLQFKICNLLQLYPSSSFFIR